MFAEFLDRHHQVLSDCSFRNTHLPVQDGELAPGRGYDVFINRIKWSVCAEWKITDRHTLCLYGLFDYDINRKYFVTADNTVSYDLDEDYLPAIGIRFKHLF